MAYVPGEADRATASFIVDVAEVATDDGVNDTVTPCGGFEAVRLTVCAGPVSATVTVDDVFPPRLTLALVGDSDIVNDDAAVAPHARSAS
jgi:hypothetical protein